MNIKSECKCFFFRSDCCSFNMRRLHYLRFLFLAQLWHVECTTGQQIVSYCRQYCTATLLSWHPGLFPAVPLWFSGIYSIIRLVSANKCVHWNSSFTSVWGPHSHYVAFIRMYLHNNNTTHTHNLSWHAGKMQKGAALQLFHCTVDGEWGSV